MFCFSFVLKPVQNKGKGKGEVVLVPKYHAMSTLKTTKS